MKNKAEIVSKKIIFIGVSWPYASGGLHMGHLAGQHIAADVFSRYNRMRGRKVLIVSGSDCHGAPVVYKAEEMGISIEKLVNDSHSSILDTYQKLDLYYDNYTRTDTAIHKEVAKNLFSVIEKYGYIKKDRSKQYYDTEVNRFLPDRYVRGTCPYCKAKTARGDECPECGAYLNPDDLIDLYSTLSQSKPIIKETEHYYLDLSKLEPHLKEWINERVNWRKWVLEFSKGELEEGLHSRCITRDMDYGVDIPEHLNTFKDSQKKVMYVWFEAVIGYLSAAIEWSIKNNKSWEEFWKSDNSQHYYFIAGGNVPFHTLIWPGELIAYNNKYKTEEDFKKYKLQNEVENKPLNLPYDVPANKTLLRNGLKMSRGDNTGISVAELINRYNKDYIRYFFIRNSIENIDREFRWIDFVNSTNNELADIIGNLTKRVTKLANRIDTSYKFSFDDIDKNIADITTQSYQDAISAYEDVKLGKVTDIVLDLGRYVNKYFNDKAPWKETVVDNKNRVLNSVAYSLFHIAIALSPIIPTSSNKILSSIGIDIDLSKYTEDLDLLDIQNILSSMKYSDIKPEVIIFEKIEYTEEFKVFDNPINK